MSPRFPPSNTSEPRFSRERTPPRLLDRRPSFNDGPSRTTEPGYRSNDSYGYRGRGREPPREPPRGPKALIDGPRGGGYIPRGRGGFPGRGEREFRDTRDESFARRGRGQDWGPKDRFERRPSPIGRDRSRSPLSRDFRDARDTRDHPPRGDIRRESKETLPSVSIDSYPRGRGGFRGRGRARGDWDSAKGRGLHLEERDNYGPRSHSREREWEKPIRDDRDREHYFEPARRDDENRRDRDDRERDDRPRREAPPYRPDSRNSTGGAPTPITSRSTSTTSIHLANLDRFGQNTRDSRDMPQEPRPRYSGPGADRKAGSVERESDKSEPMSRRREHDGHEPRIVSPPPQAPPVPAFGSIPNRPSTANQEPQSKQGPHSDRSPLVHPSRLGLLDTAKEAPSAPKALTLSNAPTAPKAQQASDKWLASNAADLAKRVSENDGTKFGAPRTVTGSTNPISRGAPYDHARNLSKRFSLNDTDTPPTRSSIPPVHGTSDSTQPSVKKAVEEQGRNGNASSTGPSISTYRPPLGDMSNQSSPVKIPTGPRAERAPTSARQPAPPIARGPPIRGPPMIPRTGRGGGAWSWVNPDLPKHTPRGPSQPSIMNTVPTKRDSIGEDKSKTTLPSAESAESAIAKWRRANAPGGTSASPHMAKEIAPSQPSPGIMHRVPTTRDPIKEEKTDNDESKDHDPIIDDDKDDNDSDEATAEDMQMDLDEEDYAEAERKFEREMQALQIKRPPTPRSNPQLLGLLEELDALASALQEKTKSVPVDGEPSVAPISTGLPSPKLDDTEEIAYKREKTSSPLPIKIRPQTPPIESLPFLNSGPLTPLSEIEELQEDLERQDAVETLIVEELIKQRETILSEDDIAKETFANTYKSWRMSVEDFEETRKLEDSLPDSSGVEDMQLATPMPSVVGRRGRVISELAMDEVLRISQETAAKEERARREREGPVYLPPETFNPEREAVVPDMLSRIEAHNCMYTDTNNLVDPQFVLDALCFIPRQDDFTAAEHETFLCNYLIHPKRFGMIAAAMGHRDFRECVQHYYLTKRSAKYKDREAVFMKTKRGKKIATQLRGQIRPRASALMSTFDGMIEYEAQNVALTEKGRPRRAAAPTFGDVVEAEAAAPTSTPARRSAAAGKESINGAPSSEKPTVRRSRAPTKEKPGRKPKTQLLAAAPGPSPQKSLPDSGRDRSKEPVVESEPRIDELDGAQVLAGLSTGQPYNMQVYQQPPVTAWHTNHPPPAIMDQSPQHVPRVTQDQPQPPQQRTGGASQTSSYWSVPEQQDFYNLVRHFGTNWQAIASTMKTKTHIMIKNFYSRKIKEGPQGQQLEQDAKQTDSRIANGEDMGPLPAPTPTGEKRRYMYNILKQEHRPLAPSTPENADVENGSPKPQLTTKAHNPTRFKQEPPKFTTLASAEQGAAQTSEQMMAQGQNSLENRITIPLQTKTQQHVIGPHLGTFIPAERGSAVFSTRETIKEKEQREMQARQQVHEIREREIQRQQDRESLTQHRHRVSQQNPEPAPKTYPQQVSSLVSDPLKTSLLSQPPSAPQSGLATTPAIEVKFDEKTRIFIQTRERQQLHLQEQQKLQREQSQQQRQTMQQTPLQQILQRQAPIDTSMRRLGSGAFSMVPSQFTPGQSPASASQPVPPMSPPGKTLRPSSVPVQASAQPPPAAPTGPPKKSSIMDILNTDSEPPTRKRLSDQRPAASTPPPPPPIQQSAGQPMQPQIPRRETPVESISHIQQQQRPPFNQQMQQQQHQSQLRDVGRNWASAAQQVGQQRSWLEERPVQAQSAISPQPQSSYLPTSSRPSFQTLQRNHVPSPPPFSHPTHSRTSSYTSNVQPSQMQQKTQTVVQSTPAEPNIRPSPYASLNPQQQQQQQQQSQQQHAHQHQHQQQQHQQQQQQMHIQQVVLEQQQRRQEQEYRLQNQQQQQQQQYAQQHYQRQEDRFDNILRQRKEHQALLDLAEREKQRYNRLGGPSFYGDGRGPPGGGYEERR